APADVHARRGASRRCGGPVRRALSALTALVSLAAVAACSPATPSTAPGPAPSTLKDAFAGSFLVGAALNESQFTEQDSRGVPIVTAQFNTVTPENILKWENVHPRPGEYAFDAPDRYVAFGERKGMFIVGHTLVWHQ